ncbi:IPTL-CTERM sorting domain-containing protein [Brevundimonas sp. DC300-4]|uniref:IPTL-CTERM sorting domain-containing protein n=1 Tax=Brevundimonas sp. DC300-4 TaxID=2804594 RepID=UPI003CF04F58
MKLLALVVAIAASMFAGAALAAPVVWTLNGVTTADGQTVTGSFTYDSDTNTYSAINITSTGGVGPFTAIATGPGSSSTQTFFIQTPAGIGQNGVVLVTSGKTNAGGTLTINTGAGAGGLYTCLGACTSGTLTAGRHITAGTFVGVAPAAVPTLSEWAMILFGLMLAGGAALYIQRRQIIA